MISKEQLRKVAIYCDSYQPEKEEVHYPSANINNQDIKSCENCSHFTKDHKCDIDLIDKILSSLAMEQDLKS